MSYSSIDFFQTWLRSQIVLYTPNQLTVGAKLYPPKNKEELRRLYEQIEESETDSLKKTCFYYYILKDFRLDIKFAAERAIPEQFCQLISGFYAFDHLQFEVTLDNKVDSW